MREEPSQDSLELSPAWTDEVVRRVEAYERGELATVDGEEAFRRLRAKHGGQARRLMLSRFILGAYLAPGIGSVKACDKADVMSPATKP